MVNDDFPTWNDILSDVYDLEFNSDKSDLLSQYRVNIEQLLVTYPERTGDMRPVLRELKKKIKHYDRLVVEEVKSKKGRATVSDVESTLQIPKEEFDTPPNSDNKNIAITAKTRSKPKTGDVIVPDRSYSIEDAAAILGRAKNTLYDYNNRKRQDGSSNPKIPYHKDEAGKVWYLGSDLLEFRDTHRENRSEVVSKEPSVVRRKHEGKGKRPYDSKRDPSKMSVPELKILKNKMIDGGEMK